MSSRRDVEALVVGKRYRIDYYEIDGSIAVDFFVFDHLEDEDGLMYGHCQWTGEDKSWDVGQVIGVDPN